MVRTSKSWTLNKFRNSQIGRNNDWKCDFCYNYLSLTYDHILWSHHALRLGLSEVCRVLHHSRTIWCSSLTWIFQPLLAAAWHSRILLRFVSDIQTATTLQSGFQLPCFDIVWTLFPPHEVSFLCFSMVPFMGYRSRALWKSVLLNWNF